jgi:hypothetical protein
MAVQTRQVFLSYASDDRQTARRLAEGLRALSLDVWSDESLGPGENWAEQMAKALGQADAMVVLLTPKSVESKWVRRDVEYALSSPRFERRLVPVVIGAGSGAWLDKAPWVLKKFDMVSSPNAASASKLVADVLKKADRVDGNRLAHRRASKLVTDVLKKAG